MSNWIEIKDILGTDRIPIRAAYIINKAVKKAIKDGDLSINNKWQIIEYLAADYLAGE